jgi:hypothetical protein
VKELLLKATRVWLPIGIAVVGLAAIIAGRGKPNNLLAGAGVALVLVAITVWMINWMYRMSIESNRERDQEEAARDFFDLHGYWPDEPKPMSSEFDDDDSDEPDDE